LKDTQLLENGLEIRRKENLTYIGYVISDITGLTKKATFNNKSKKNIGASFNLSSFKDYGIVKQLSEEEMKKRHSGSTKFTLKLNEEMSEKNVIEKIIIPGCIKTGLKTSKQFFEEYQDPFKLPDGPFITGFCFHSYTNERNELWVAYINQHNGDIWVSSNDDPINWKWAKLDKDVKKFPYLITEFEENWLTLLLQTAQAYTFHKRLKKK